MGLSRTSLVRTQQAREVQGSTLIGIDATTKGVLLLLVTEADGDEGQRRFLTMPTVQGCV